MIDMPIPVRAIDSDAHGQAPSGLPEAALMVLAQEVILRLARWAQEAASRRAALSPSVACDIDALCDALTGIDPGAAKVIIMDAHERGASHEELCLYHIGEAARRLGELWDEDRLSYHGMAVAAGRILHLLKDLRDLAPPFDPRGTRSALFATVPGEMHVLGVTMAADLFREDGWEIDLKLDKTEAELSDLVQRGGYAIVGLSASSLDRVRALARVVVELRLISPKILIFVGGYIAKLEPDIAIRVGADGAAWEMERCKGQLEHMHEQLPEIMGYS